MTSPPTKIQRLRLASPALDPNKTADQRLTDHRQTFEAPDYAITRDERGVFAITGSECTVCSDGSTSWVEAQPEVVAQPEQTAPAAPVYLPGEGRLQTQAEADADVTAMVGEPVRMVRVWTHHHCGSACFLGADREKRLVPAGREGVELPDDAQTREAISSGFIATTPPTEEMLQEHARVLEEGMAELVRNGGDGKTLGPPSEASIADTQKFVRMLRGQPEPEPDPAAPTPAEAAPNDLAQWLPESAPSASDGQLKGISDVTIARDEASAFDAAQKHQHQHRKHKGKR